MLSGFTACDWHLSEIYATSANDHSRPFIVRPKNLPKSGCSLHLFDRPTLHISRPSPIPIHTSPSDNCLKLVYLRPLCRFSLLAISRFPPFLASRYTSRNCCRQRTYAESVSIIARKTIYPVRIECVIMPATLTSKDAPPAVEHVSYSDGRVEERPM